MKPQRKEINLLRGLTRLEEQKKASNSIGANNATPNNSKEGPRKFPPTLVVSIMILVVSVITVIATFFGGYDGVEEQWGDILNIRSDDLKVKSVYFSPSSTQDFGGNFTQELVSVKVRLRNNGTKIFNITGADLSGVDWQVERGLSPEFHGRLSQPKVVLEPGEFAEVKIPTLIKMKGLALYLEKEGLYRLDCIPKGDGTFTVENRKWAAKINEQISNLYGENTTMVLRLYQGNGKILKRYIVELDDGVDMFGEGSGKIRYDHFLGQLIANRNKTEGKEELCLWDDLRSE